MILIRQTGKQICDVKGQTPPGTSYYTINLTIVFTNIDVSPV